MDHRRVLVPGSVVQIVYDGSDTAPPQQEERLERALGRLFPESSNVATIAVEVGWSDAYASWWLHRAHTTIGDTSVEITRSLSEALEAQGIPIIDH